MTATAGSRGRSLYDHGWWTLRQFLILGALLLVTLAAWNGSAMGPARRWNILFPTDWAEAVSTTGSGRTEEDLHALNSPVNISDERTPPPSDDDHDNDDREEDNNNNIMNYHDLDTSFDSSLSIRLGELPGYTGWGRSPFTLAGYFVVEEEPPPLARTGQPWSISVTCLHEQGQEGGAEFFVRAYGRAILPGRVQDWHNGTYTISILPFDAGLYQVEVVLTFSKPVPVEQLPMNNHSSQQGYEGFLLPDFPWSLRVVESAHEDGARSLLSSEQTPATPHSNHSTEKFNTSQNNGFMDDAVVKSSGLRLCTMEDLVERRYGQAVEMARWVVMEKVTNFPYQNVESQVSLEGYQYSINSLGIRMGYVPTRGCSLLTHEDMLDQATWLHAAQPLFNNISSSLTNLKNNTRAQLQWLAKRIHVIFIGDSNLRLQLSDFFQFYMGRRISKTYIYTNHGIVNRLPFIKQELQDLLAAHAQQPEKVDYFIIFNTGLHDVAQMCDFGQLDKHLDQLPHSKWANFSCIQQYEETLPKFIELVRNFPAALRVWQSTTASWPKWGVYGAAWPPNTPQRMPKSPHVVEAFNRVAWRLLAPYADEIAVMDAYWMTLSRPDHRRISPDNSLPDHLMHAGPEVYSALCRQWGMMILGAIQQLSAR